MKISEITVEKLAEFQGLDFQTMTAGEIDEQLGFLTAAKQFIENYTGLDAQQIDIHEDLTIAAMLLVQDMSDNRSVYVDKNNLNHVLQTILNFHSVNLL